MALATFVTPNWLEFSGRCWPSSGLVHSRRTRDIKEAREKDASLLPGNITLSTLIELWAAIRYVEVRYSDRKMGASANCSARVRAVDTAPPTAGRVSGAPPNKAWSTRDVVRPTAVVVTNLVIENPIFVLVFSAEKPREVAEDARSIVDLLYASQVRADEDMPLSLREN